MRRYPYAGYVGLIGTFLAGALLVGGCFNLNAPKTVTVGDEKGQTKDKTVTKRDATRIAEKLAQANDFNPDSYDVNTEKIGDAWWVLFDHKIRGYKLESPYHFAVRVTQDGKSTFFKSP